MTEDVDKVMLFLEETGVVEPEKPKPSDELIKARKMLYDLLLSPYNESSHYQISVACAYLQHPMRPPRKHQENPRCICGMVKGKEIA